PGYQSSRSASARWPRRRREEQSQLFSRWSHLSAALMLCLLVTRLSNRVAWNIPLRPRIIQHYTLTASKFHRHFQSDPRYSRLISQRPPGTLLLYYFSPLHTRGKHVSPARLPW